MIELENEGAENGHQLCRLFRQNCYPRLVTKFPLAPV